jgi:hypothetical protein
MGPVEAYPMVPLSWELLQNGGFFNTCTMKRCLHRKGGFKTNALNNAHGLLLHYKAGLLQNEGIIIYL